MTRRDKPCTFYIHKHAGQNCRCIKLCEECGWDEGSHRTKKPDGVVAIPVPVGSWRCGRCGVIYEAGNAAPIEITIKSQVEVKTFEAHKEVTECTSIISLCALCFNLDPISDLHVSWNSHYSSRREYNVRNS